MMNKDRLTMEVVHQVAEQNPMFIQTLATSMGMETHALVKKITAGTVSLPEAFLAFTPKQHLAVNHFKPQTSNDEIGVAVLQDLINLIRAGKIKISYCQVAMKPFSLEPQASVPPGSYKLERGGPQSLQMTFD